MKRINQKNEELLKELRHQRETLEKENQALMALIRSLKKAEPKNFFQ